jgi:hypothetical protein
MIVFVRIMQCIITQEVLKVLEHKSVLRLNSRLTQININALILVHFFLKDLSTVYCGTDKENNYIAAKECMLLLVVTLLHDVMCLR